MNLVIIEGVGKKDTIKKYLGKNFTVFATKGHVRDLPAKSLAVDVKGDFSPKYSVMPDKKDIVKQLKEKAKKVDKIYLATDPDREGEAIAWHLAHILKIPKDEKCRIVFNEISKKAVTESILKPRVIDQNLVDAQQARRILDRLVGYKLSPIICKKIRSKLSAGRVQSVALKLVVDRERKILDFKPEEYWHLNAHLEKIGKKPEFNALLTKYKNKNIKITSAEQVAEIEKNLMGANYKVSSLKKIVTKSHATPPFITSTMQQDAFNKLGMGLKRTTSSAQNLYEGIKLPEGKTALVTYIRSDSTRVSEGAIEMVRGHIVNKYGKEYLPEKPNFYKSKKSAQDAHEAIRPINTDITPEYVKQFASSDQYRLYKLVYERFVASQMNEATFDSITAIVEANEYNFKITGKTPKFLGFRAVYQNYLNETDAAVEKKTNETKLPALIEGDELKLLNLLKDQKFTKPPARFTEAMLGKEMEDKGIGRPATYAPTILVLSYRRYVEKEEKRLKPTELGFAVNDMLQKFFNEVINVHFTADMEIKLDEIAEEGTSWRKVIANFYKWFEKFLKIAGEDTTTQKIEPIVTDEICEKCGANMVIREGRYGKFLACPNFPTCKNIRNIKKEPEKAVGKCPDCGKDVFARKSRTGRIFYGCSGYPDCKFMSWGIPMEEKCIECGNYLIKNENKQNINIKCSNKECGYKRIEPLPKKEEKEEE